MASNLAVAKAHMGHKVLLVDADMRHSCQQQIWKLPNLLGLSNVLVSQAEFSRTTQEVLVNLDVLTVGTIPPNPAALLDSQRMALLIQEAAKDYDYVIIDTPALSLFGDGLMLGKMADGILLVVRPGVLDSAVAKSTKIMLEQARLRVLGMVVNGVTADSGYMYYSKKGYYDNLPQQDRNYAANFTGILLTLYPSALWYSTQLVRDLLLVLFAILNIYLFIIILKRGKQSLWIWWVITLFIVYFLRNYAGVGLLMGFFAYLTLIWKVKIQRKLFVLALVLIPCALVPYFFGQGIFGFEHIAPTLNTEEIARQRENAYSTGGSSTGISIDYSNPINFIFTYGQSYINAMLGPLPWQMKSLVTLITLPEVIGMWILYFQLWQSWSGRTIKNKNNEEILLLITCLIQVGIFALFSDNIGANTRLRLLPWISFFIYASIHFAKKRASIRNLAWNSENP